MNVTTWTALVCASVCALVVGGCVGTSGSGGGGVPTGGGGWNPDAASSGGDAASSGGTSSGGASSGASSGGTSSGGASSGGTSSGGNSSGGVDTNNLTKGKYTGVVVNEAFELDYTGAATNIVMQHRQGSDAFMCVPHVEILAIRTDGTCPLTLRFESDATGVGKLTAATFSAKTINGSDVKPCVGFPDTSKWVKATEQMEFSLSGGEATLPMPLLKQPGGGQSVAQVSGQTLQPKGIAELQHKGIKLHLDLSAVVFVGNAKSHGNPELSCTGKPANPPYTPLPDIKLPDVNPNSATYGKVVDINGFQGKYVVILAGAGWCASCITQSEYMHKMEAKFGKSKVQMIALNDPSAKSSSQQKMLAAKGKATFPVLQGTSSVGWATLKDCMGKKGKKNDAFIWAPDGRFIRKHEGKGTVYLNVFEDDVTQAVNTPTAALDDCTCQNVIQSTAKIHHVACK